MTVRTLSRCCSLLSDGISKFSEMFVVLRFFVKFDRSGHAKFFTFWEITEREIYRSRTLQINPTNVIACWSSCDHFSKQYGWFTTVLKIFDFSSNLTSPDLQFLDYNRACEISSTNHPSECQELIKMMFTTLGWFLKCLTFSDFSSNLTGPDMQNFSLFGKSQNGRSIDQDRFKSTLLMSQPIDHHMTTLGSSMNGFQRV